MTRSTIAVLAMTLTMVACGRSSPTGSLPLRFVRDIPLPGDTSRFDYQDIDPGRRRLYVAHLGASRVEVIDLDNLTVIHSITGISMVHGIRVAPALGRVYASATGTNQVVTVDQDTFAEVARTPTGRYPDGIAYDATHQKVFVSNEHGGSETVIDARTGALLGTVDLGGDAGNVALDTGTGMILVAVQSRNEIDHVDPVRLQITQRTHLDGCDNSHGLTIDANNRLAFAACDANNRLLVINLDTMRTLARYDLGDGPDVLALDQSSGRLYVAAEDGTVSAFSVNHQTVRPLGHAHVAEHAHSVTIDPNTHHVYFPLQSVSGHPVLRVMAPD